MITYGIGIDLVTIARFEGWHTKPRAQLLKVFSDEELHDCFKRYGETTYSSFFASRFAMKEAFFKALSQTLINLNYNSFPSFSQTRRYVALKKYENGAPYLNVQWNNLETILNHSFPPLKTLCSLSHEKDSAIALVTIVSN